MYSPGESAPFEELERLCRVMARRGKVYATHMRDYGFRLPEAVDEQIELARRTGCRLQISHLQAGRTRSLGHAGSRPRKDRARARGGGGCRVRLLPLRRRQHGADATSAASGARRRRGGTDGAVDGPGGTRAHRARDRRRHGHRWTRPVHLRRWLRRPTGGWSGGASRAIADERGCEPMDAMFDLLVEERGAVNMLEFNQSEENLRQTLTHPLSMIISDGFYVKGRPHPRLHGTFPELLGGICREKRWMDLPEAIHKITAASRRALRLRGPRPHRSPGYRADIGGFRRGRASAAAPLTTNPQQPPVGIHCVLRDRRVHECRIRRRYRDGLQLLPDRDQQRAASTSTPPTIAGR